MSFFKDVVSSMDTPIHVIGEKLGIDFINAAPLSDKFYLAKAGLFFLVLFMVFWMILHRFVYMISSSIARYLFPMDDDLSKIQKVDANSLWKQPPKPGVRQRTLNRDRSKGIKQETTTTDKGNNITKIILKRVKFDIAFWKTFNYSFLIFVGLKILWSADWLSNYQEYAIPRPFLEITTTIYYHLAISSYIYGLFCLINEPRMKDFVVMFAHHLVTLLLLIGSYYLLGSVHIGMMVMILHDICDPFMEIAKVCLYANLHLFANVFFLVFALIFIISRCIIYPIFVIYPTFALLSNNQYHPIFARAHVLMLCIIFFMDLYWSFLILKMVVTQVLNGALKGDVREDADDDDDE